MANVDAPDGARVYGHLTGGVLRYAPAIHRILSTYNTSIFSGDFVKRVTDGTIEQAAATDRILGVFAGCEFVDAAGNQQYSPYWPANQVATQIKANVISDPTVLWQIQSAGSTVEADIGELTDIVVGTGSTTSGRSAMEANGTTGTGAAQLRIMGKVESPDNDWGTNVKLIVQVFEHEYAEHGQATPGV